MDDNIRAKLNNSLNENKRLTRLTDSESQTSAPMLFKGYTTSISPNSPPTHYFWPAIVPNSQVCISSGQSPSSDSHSSHQSDVILYPLKKKKRRANPIPAESKDEAYWERRKRNNESAKRSREIRRAKEHQTNARVMFLEQENVKLKAEVDTLREEIGKLREMLYNGRHSRRDD